jgi:hypothetical protein
MEKGRHPHVIRTWAVDRIRQHAPAGPVKNINAKGQRQTPKKQTPPQKQK